MYRYHHQEYNSKNYISLTRNSEFNFEVLELSILSYL